MDKGKLFRFVARKKIGKCPCCPKDVYDDQLYVAKDENVYHHSCFNLKAKDKEDNE